MLKGFDQLVNLVLDEAVEFIRGAWRGWRAGCARAPSARASVRAQASTPTTPRRAHSPAPLADPADPLRITDETRGLGLVVCRGPQVTVVCPEDELREIPNPFVAPEGAEE